MDGLSRRRALRAGLFATGVAGATGGVIVGAKMASSDPAAAPRDGWISVLDHGAVGDGRADDTTAIQAALDRAAATTPSGSVYLPPGRVYRVTRGLVASGLTDFVLCAYGATLALGGAVGGPKGTMSVLRLSDCHRFRVLGLSIQDTDRAQTYDGILVSGSSAGVIDGVQIRDVKWAGIGVFDATPQTSRDITITNCVVEGTRFGISVNGADIRVTNNHVAMYWPSTAEAAAKGGVWSAPSDYYDGIMVLQGADRIVVAGNTVIECGQSGIYINACTNLVVTGNMVSGCQLRGIELDGGAGTAVGASIVANTVTGCVCQINLVRARDITVVGNRLLNPNPALANTCLGVNVGTTNVVVVGNHLDQSNPNSPAVWVDPGATEVTIAWNEVKAATPYQAPPGVAIAYRGAAGHLTTSGRLIASGGIGVGNRLPASTLGPVSGKIEVFSATGASLGWVPVYQSIS